jgi:hypothetical protein
MRDGVQLNCGKGWHALSERILFRNQGVFRTGEAEERMKPEKFGCFVFERCALRLVHEWPPFSLGRRAPGSWQEHDRAARR